MARSGLYAQPGSPLVPFASSLGWLWRIPLVDEPSPAAVGIGGLDEAAELHARLAAGDLAGVAVMGTRPGPDQGRLPGRARLRGVADFGPGLSVSGQFTTLQGPGQAVARSSLGAHALRDGELLTLGFDPLASWGTLQDFWALPALADFLADALQRPLAMLPPLGLLRYDDVPGNAAHQLKGQDKSDAGMARRLRSLASTYAAAGAKLNYAVSGGALADGEETTADRVWPRAVEAIAEGVAAGTAETICHGYLHLDTNAHAEDGRVEPREFARLGPEESLRRVKASLEWSELAIGKRPATFVAPNWIYGEGLRSALDELELPAWLPLAFGPLVEGRNAHETLISTLDGLHRLDYAPLAALAGTGLPPYVAIHGGLFDARFAGLSLPRDAVALARLFARRDLWRLASIPGLRWVTASELLERLRAHDRVEFEGGELRAPDGVEVVLREPGRPASPARA